MIDVKELTLEEKLRLLKELKSEKAIISQQVKSTMDTLAEKIAGVIEAEKANVEKNVIPVLGKKGRRAKVSVPVNGRRIDVQIIVK